MASEKQDIKDILDYVVNSFFDEDKEFIEKQKKAGINICDKIYTEQEDGKNLIRIVTQLSVNKDINGNLDNDMHPDECRKSAAESDFYISSLTVAADDQKRTSLRTVVGLKNCDLEAVYEASVAHKPKGGKLVLHNSYLRPASKRKLSHSTSLSTPEAVEPSLKKPSSKKKSLLQRLSINRKKRSDLQEIDDLARNQVYPSTSTSHQKVKSSNKSRDHLQLINMKNPVPFSSYKIGSHPVSFKDIFSSTRSRSKSFIVTDNVPKSSKIVDTKVLATTDENSKMLSTTIDNSNNPILFHSIISPCLDDNVSLTESVFDEGGERTEVERIELQTSLDMHIDIKAQITTAGRRTSCPTTTCNCKDLRLQSIGDILKKVIKKEKLREEWQQCQRTFNVKTLHRYDCVCDSSHVRLKDWYQSHSTLHSHCESCCSLDEPISPIVRDSLDHLVIEHNFSSESRIQLSENEVDFLMKVHCYDSFERFIQNLLGTRVTPHNFSRLIFIVKAAVLQIGNPRSTRHEQIDRIYQFVIRYYGCHFKPHIDVHHRCIEDFLCNCECDNFHDPE